MRSAKRGTGTSAVEVTHVSGNGLWLLLGDEEVFLAFDSFPWFREARIADVLNVERPAPHHLYWPTLDLDIAVESIHRPERYPLVSSQSGSGASAPLGRGPGKRQPRGTSHQKERATPQRRKSGR